uniref:SIAH-type domain-containing protein n=1 Tax=Timema monikensis TaxID=170555 RepID=A0A7R9EF05_9NEOP|nr:unnamed protein product [Timema monikensis]
MVARRWRQKITPHPYSSEAVIPPLRPLLPRGELPPVKMAEGEYDAEDTISSVIGQAFRTLLHVTGKVGVANASEVCADQRGTWQRERQLNLRGINSIAEYRRALTGSNKHAYWLENTGLQRCPAWFAACAQLVEASSTSIETSGTQSVDLHTKPYLEELQLQSPSNTLLRSLLLPGPQQLQQLSPITHVLSKHVPHTIDNLLGSSTVSSTSSPPDDQQQLKQQEGLYHLPGAVEHHRSSQPEPMDNEDCPLSVTSARMKLANELYETALSRSKRCSPSSENQGVINTVRATPAVPTNQYQPSNQIQSQILPIENNQQIGSNHEPSSYIQEYVPMTFSTNQLQGPIRSYPYMSWSAPSFAPMQSHPPFVARYKDELADQEVYAFNRREENCLKQFENHTSVMDTKLHQPIAMSLNKTSPFSNNISLQSDAQPLMVDSYKGPGLLNSDTVKYYDPNSVIGLHMNRKEVDNVQIEQIGRSAAMVFPMQREAVNTQQMALTIVEPRLDGTESFTRGVSHPIPPKDNLQSLNSSLDFIMNLKAVSLTGPAPVFPGLRPATTSIFECYTKPICSAACTPDVEPLQPTGDLGCLIGEQGWNQGQDLYPQFQHNNQLSFPLIYNYLASTEDQQLEERLPLRPPMSIADDLPDMRLPISIHGPLATSSPIDRSDIVEAENIPQLDESTLALMYDPTPQRDSCRYQNQGCLKNLRAELMADHEPSCEYQPTSCPLVNHPQCPWGGKLRDLDRHLRETHNDVIVPGAERCHLVEMHKVRANQSICFVQETQERLYVISVHCKGRLLLCTIQVVSTNLPERVGSVRGALEVVGVDGKPHGWMGKIRPVHDPVESLWEQGQCLRVDPNAIGACSSSTIRLHALVMVQTPSNRGKKRSKVARPSAKRRIASRT